MSNWKLISNPITNDTIIQYEFQKKDLRNIRLYVVTLEKYYSLYKIDEQIITRQAREIENYKIVVNNQNDIIEFNEDVNSELNKINQRLTLDIVKYKKREKRWPYLVGAGLIGGFVLCKSIK